MAIANRIQSNFAGGEVSRKVSSRLDIDVYYRSLMKCQNFIPQFQGGVEYRPGTSFLGNAGLVSAPSVLIPFVYRDTQGYQIELWVDTNDDLNFRFWKDDGVLQYTGSEQGWVINDAAGLGTTDSELIGFAGGVGKDPDFTTNTVATSGDVTMILTGTFTIEELQSIQFTQNGDALILTSRDNFLIQLWRGSTSETAWAVNEAKSGTAAFHSFTFEFTTPDITDFVTDLEFPEAVAFNEGRLWFGRDDILYGSKAIVDGVDGYVSFTIAASPTIAASDAVMFAISVSPNSIDLIHWLTSTQKGFFVGMENVISPIIGSTATAPISATSIRVPGGDNQGCYAALPATTGSDVIYIAKGQRKLQAFKYDLLQDTERSYDLTLLADHLGFNFKKIVFQRGYPDIVWVLKTDGTLYGCVYLNAENINGWFTFQTSHLNVFDISVSPSTNGQDRLWVVVSRTIFTAADTFSTEYHIEQLEINERFVTLDDFFTDNEGEDERRWKNALYEQQRAKAHMDGMVVYNGFGETEEAGHYLHLYTIGGIIEGCFVSTAGTTGSKLVTTASPLDGNTGHILDLRADTAGLGEGRFEITGYLGVLGNASVDILKEIADKTHDDVEDWYLIQPGDWAITVSEVTAATSSATLHHLRTANAAMVEVVADGGSLGQKEIEIDGGNYVIDLGDEVEVSIVHAGELMIGFIRTMNLDVGGVRGTAYSKVKAINKVGVGMLDTMGVSFGSDSYDVQTIPDRVGYDISDRPGPLFSGIQDVQFNDGRSIEKNLIVMQKLPLPCTVVGLDVEQDTSDE